MARSKLTSKWALIIGVALGGLAGTSLYAQDAAPTRRIPVYIIPDTTEVQPEFAPFAYELTRYELMRIPRLQPTIARTAPACGLIKPGARDSAVSEPVNVREFFLVLMQFKTDISESTLDAHVVHCSPAGDRTLFHDPRVVRISDPLSDLSTFTNVAAEAIRSAIPRIDVRVVANDRATQPTRNLAFTTRVVDAVWAAFAISEEIRAVEAGGDYTLLVTTPARKGMDTLVVAVELLAGPQRIGSVSARGAEADVVSLAREISRQAAHRIQEHRYTNFVKASGDKNTARDTLLARANAALCIGADKTCVTNPDAAQAAVSAALRRDSSLVEAHIIDARIATIRRNVPGAIRALVASEKWIDDATSRGTLGAFYRLMGDAYRDVGNYGSAERAYLRASRALPDSTAIIFEIARAARASGRVVEAAQTLSVLAARGDTAAIRNLTTLIADIQPEEVRSEYARMLPVCASISAVQEQCAETIIDNIRRAGASPDEVKKVFYMVIDALDKAPSATAHAMAALTSTYLGPISYDPDSADRLRPSFRQFASDSATFYLIRAEQAANAGAGDRARDFVRRVRAIFTLAEATRERDNQARLNKMFEAKRLAEAARDNFPSREGEFAVTQATFVLALELHHSGDARAVAMLEEVANRATRLVYSGLTAAHLYMREANHLLQRDEVTRTELNQILSGSRKQPDASASLAYLCSEHLADFACAFEASQAAISRRTTASYADSLELFEYAVLGNKADVAEEIYAGLARRSPDVCRRMVTEFYATWFAFTQNKPEDARRRASQWRNQIEVLRANRTPRCWIFKGAKTRLAQIAGTMQQSANLAAMIAAMERDDSPLPEVH